MDNLHHPGRFSAWNKLLYSKIAASNASPMFRYIHHAHLRIRPLSVLKVIAFLGMSTRLTCRKFSGYEMGSLFFGELISVGRNFPRLRVNCCPLVSQTLSPIHKTSRHKDALGDKPLRRRATTDNQLTGVGPQPAAEGLYRGGPGGSGAQQFTRHRPQQL